MSDIAKLVSATSTPSQTIIGAVGEATASLGFVSEERVDEIVDEKVTEAFAGYIPPQNPTDSRVKELALETVVEEHYTTETVVDTKISTALAGYVPNLSNAYKSDVLYGSGSTYAVPSAATPLVLGTHNFGYLSTAGSTITILKRGRIDLRFQSVIEKSSGADGVFYATTRRSGTPLSNALRMKEVSTFDSEFNLMWSTPTSTPVEAGETYDIALLATFSSGAVNLKAPITPSGLAGATGALWRLEFVFVEMPNV